MVREHLKEFLEHLRLNENASAHTVRAYDSDLSQYVTFLASYLNRRASDLSPADLDHLNARAFLGDLNRRGNSKASAARKLSAIRAFGRYLRREGVLEGDPAALVGTPKREQRIPAHLAIDEMSKLLEMPDTQDPLGESAPLPSGEPGSFPRRFLVKGDGQMYFVAVEDIDWIEAYGNYVRLHVGKSVHLIRETLGNIERKLDATRFARVHRSSIVNLDRVARMDLWGAGDYVVLLKDGTKLKLSRWYRSRIEQQTR